LSYQAQPGNPDHECDFITRPLEAYKGNSGGRRRKP
jgi:hypothetical protein